MRGRAATVAVGGALGRAAVVGAGGAALVLAAFTFEAAILFVPGLGLIAVALLAPGWILLAAGGTRVSRRIHADRVVEGQPLEATMRLRHGWLGLPGCEVLDPLVGGAMTVRPRPLTRRRRDIEVRVVARFERRGRRLVEPPRLWLSDPLGIVRLERPGTGAGQQVLVLPRTERPRLMDGGLAQRLSGDSGAAAIEPVAAIEVDGLRPYRDGTPASRIHWQALARGAGLLERRLRADAGTGPLVVLDVRCPQAGERLDQAVRAAASLTLELARQGGCELLLPGDRRAITVEADLGAWPGAHARLALVTGGPDAPAPLLLPRGDRVFYIAADLEQRPLRALEHVPQAVLVLPRELAPQLHQPPSFSVSGCVGVVIGTGGAHGSGARRQAA